MTRISLDWQHEEAPGWDSTGTIAESWTAYHGRYECRVDRFKESEGGGFAYSVFRDGNPLPDAENVSSESMEAAIITAETALAHCA